MLFSFVFIASILPSVASVFLLLFDYRLTSRLPSVSVPAASYTDYLYFGWEESVYKHVYERWDK